MSTARIPISRWRRGSAPSRALDELAAEEPLEIQVETRPVSVTMRTPGHDAELAAGFLLGEGVITSAAQIRAIRPHPRNPLGNAVNVFLADGVTVDLDALARHVFASSSCGICGKASIAQVHRRFRPLRAGAKVRAETLLALPERMRAGQEDFERSGGLHAAALFTLDGALRVLREDIGRHNAVDKVIGHAALAGWLPLDDSILLVSGRASFEILQKALAARIPVVAAVSAPSSLAADFARRSRQVLVGFLREDRLNVYSGRGRVLFPRRRAAA